MGAGQSATATGIIPAATPKTLNSMGVGQDGGDPCMYPDSFL